MMCFLIVEQKFSTSFSEANGGYTVFIGACLLADCLNMNRWQVFAVGAKCCKQCRDQSGHVEFAGCILAVR